MKVSEIPIAAKMLIELYREEEFSHYFFHALIGRSANDALSRIVAWRVKNRIGGNALVTIDDYGFLLTLRPFQEMPLEDWRLCFEEEGAKEDLYLALRGSELVKWQFRGVAQTGLMVPRNVPGQQRKRKQMNWSSEVLFRVLEQHEPDHPLLEEAYRQAMHTFPRCGSGLRFPSAFTTRLEASELPADFAVLVSDLRQRHQGKHDAGGSIASPLNGFIMKCMREAGMLAGEETRPRMAIRSEIQKGRTLRSTPSRSSELGFSLAFAL